jgi:tryptophan synthase alpha subunit
MPAMNRLTTVLSSLRERRKKALALFLTAGYPAADSTPGLVLSLAGAGADIIEIGMPFSDPLADGPVIQQSSATAIQNGVTIAGILDGIRKIRESSAVPLVLMGYINPILSYGSGRFFSDAASAGVDGVILPELTLEESVRFKSEIELNGLSQILLVAPTTPPERITAIDTASGGFLYCVSTTGVTGAAGKGTPDEFLIRVKTLREEEPRSRGVRHLDSRGGETRRTPERRRDHRVGTHPASLAGRTGRLHYLLGQLHPRGSFGALISGPDDELLDIAPPLFYIRLSIFNSQFSIKSSHSSVSRPRAG